MAPSPSPSPHPPPVPSLSLPSIPPRRHVPIRFAAMAIAALLFVFLDFLELGRHGSTSPSSPSPSKITPKFGYSSTLNLVGNKNSISEGKGGEGGETGGGRETEEEGGKKGEGINEGGEGDEGDEREEEEGVVVEWSGAPWRERVGTWLKRCWREDEVVEVEESIYGSGCPGSCGGNGVCNFQLKECRCASGFKGVDCMTPDVLECNYEPVPHSSRNEVGRWIVSACIDQAWCDKRTATCRCGPNTPFPMRPLPVECGTISKSYGILWNEKLLEDLFSNDTKKPGWCFVDPKKSQRNVAVRKFCFCTFEGQWGTFCEIPSRQYCVNGCNNHGNCNLGYCECEDGWYGLDCSIPSILPSLQDKANVPWLWPPSSPSPITIPKERLLEEDSSNTKITSRDSEKEKKNLVEEGETEKLVLRRKRPLVYVYELPGEFNFQLLQGRAIRYYCIPWFYGVQNETIWHREMLYGMEPVLLEALLSSQHRTTNGDEADFFYVPVFANCVIFRADETPQLDMQVNFLGIRSYLLADYITRAYEYIRDHFPYWNRTGGHDHLWTFPWDEGSCSAPQIVRNSTMLTSFGNTMTKHKKSTTGYHADNWDVIPKSVRGDHPCFDPKKDIVMPAWKAPDDEHIRNRLWMRPFEERPKLFYFNGNLGAGFGGRPEAAYSMGIRQKVALYFASVPNKEKKLGKLTEAGVVVTNIPSSNYGEELSSSRFCGVFPGDGFSARMEDSILHGCVPVIVQEGIQMPFENVLHYHTFTLRIKEDDIPNMIEIIQAIPESRVRSMLESVQKVWLRWTYHSVARLQGWREREWYGNTPEWANLVDGIEGDDAVATLFQSLHYKLYHDPWRKSQRSKKGRKEESSEKCFL